MTLRQTAPSTLRDWSSATRLRIPEALVQDLLDNDATRELAEDIVMLLLQTHEARFHSGDYMLARLDQDRKGARGSKDDQEHFRSDSGSCRTLAIPWARR
jgi:hypothetical protein